ncbi:MAG: SRPBCC family protein [Hymenobacteraceae bacterium]|nr:SRPBCC family protein [Hymenobacteraceae bacterium]MDX5396192.1 SRPBCC family protein [Hymenobacteraceae bacterium]MDX5443941.1 SRPBCC family protein [Hymenobacteraceae bacterium]MDX5512254.1 SRPBCC family protein [Hymenobacteraceae bacterium]
MQILKKIGLSILALLVVLVAVGFMLPAKVHVERSLVIKAKAEPVFHQINNLKNWEKWSPWHQMDPEMQLIYAGPEAGIGAKYSWTSNHERVGNGALTIKESVPFQKIITEMDFMENGVASSAYIFEETPEGTKVTWTMDSDMGYNLVSRYFGLMLDSFLGPDFEQGLQSLKNLTENQSGTEQASALVK